MTILNQPSCFTRPLNTFDLGVSGCRVTNSIYRPRPIKITLSSGDSRGEFVRIMMLLVRRSPWAYSLDWSLATIFRSASCNWTRAAASDWRNSYNVCQKDGSRYSMIYVVGAPSIFAKPYNLGASFSAAKWPWTSYEYEPETSLTNTFVLW